MKVQFCDSSKNFMIAAFCLSLLAGCGGGAAEKTANRTVNESSGGNSSASNSFDNKNNEPNFNRGETKMSLPPVDRTFLTGALKARLRHDDIHSAVDPALWSNDEWLNVRIGIIYRDRNELIVEAVSEVTTNALQPHNLRLTRHSLEQLQAGVSSDSLCQAVADEMFRRTIETERIGNNNDF